MEKEERVFNPFSGWTHTELIPVEMHLHNHIGLDRYANILSKKGIITIADLVKCRKRDLLSITKIGKKSVEDISRLLGQYSLFLEMTQEEIELYEEAQTFSDEKNEQRLWELYKVYRKKDCEVQESFEQAVIDVIKYNAMLRWWRLGDF